MGFFPPLGTTTKFLKVLSAIGFPLGETEVAIHSTSFKHPIFLRLLTSDLSAFSQIFIGDEFGQLSINDPSWVVDLGANIGATSVYFLNRWQNVKVISVEADPANFPLLVKNLKPYGTRAFPILGALTEVAGFAKILHTSGGHWSTQVEPNSLPLPSECTVPAFTMDQILSWVPGHKIDFIKMDIEGEETPVLAWLRSHSEQFTGVILAVELHNEEAVKQFDALCESTRARKQSFGEYQTLRL